MNNMTQQKCPIIFCNEVASNTFLLRFHCSPIAKSTKPGQFVNVLASEDGNGPLLRRPFSVSCIDGDSVDILFHTIGAGTMLLSKKKSGDSIDVIGPLGQPFRIDAEYKTAIIVAGGIGVAPFPLLTEELKQRGKSIETYLGFRNSHQVYKSNLLNIHLATDDGSEGFNGNVVQFLESQLEQLNSNKSKMFACGPTVMLKALTELAKKWNICCEVSLEGQMACGVGICQGCPVERNSDDLKYALVCKDGPAFLSTDIKL
jgi:dihydroorotate dehydrogenase electron transfer subunit